MMRVTLALHGYLQHLGLLRGNGVAVPDIVDNVLLEWKAQHALADQSSTAT